MTHRETLPKEISDKLDEVLRETGAAERAGDIKGSEKLRKKAWDMLPEPKLSWDYYSNIMPRNNTEFYKRSGQFDEALRWLEVTRESYESTPEEPDPSTEFLAATVYHDMGDTDKAFAIFDMLHKKWKQRPFKEKDPKYLDFYLNEKKKKK